MGKYGRKFYVVRRGRVPGIYSDWEPTQAQVSGVPGADFKAFPSLAEAEAYAAAGAFAGGAAPPAAQQQHLRGAKFFAVKRGRSVGVFLGFWGDVQHLVEKLNSAPGYFSTKGFSSEKEARAWLNEGVGPFSATGSWEEAAAAGAAAGPSGGGAAAYGQGWY
ncbi:hypothetical protein Rsub_02950 [Raphidocelis subcapitata]|uniref:ribonuclease H n=1 Tax=Raphidocelis subcapitata TaxID=307507 RepID=A0A2V0NW37_9CHLO|nr:hypothetical protein Rsub_02950 [Raphidocelis subcapitata]|eukprot:GBF89780.1 hypothetical protein Rsub_02950 [Raphidocelis subcapitata]